MKKLTDWFKGSQKPARKGVYERRLFESRLVHSMWDGRKWLYSRTRAEDAAVDKRTSTYQSAPWRGLAEDPSGGAK